MPKVSDSAINLNGFASTSWTVVFDAADSKGSKHAHSALSSLCQTYWRPIYFFLRREGFDPHDAQDLTQGFFADLIENRSYARAHPSKGQFRSFLLGAVKHFVANVRDHDGAQKRGGDAVRVSMKEAEIAEAQNNFAEGWSAELVYEREWAEALLRRALDRLEKESMLAGRGVLFDSLKRHLSPNESLSLNYEGLSQQLGRPIRTLRSDLTRLRARYRVILREEVGDTLEQPSQIDEELRYLCRVVARNYDESSPGASAEDSVTAPV